MVYGDVCILGLEDLFMNGSAYVGKSDPFFYSYLCPTGIPVHICGVQTLERHRQSDLPNLPCLMTPTDLWFCLQYLTQCVLCSQGLTIISNNTLPMTPYLGLNGCLTQFNCFPFNYAIQVYCNLVCPVYSKHNKMI